MFALFFFISGETIITVMGDFGIEHDDVDAEGAPRSSLGSGLRGRCRPARLLRKVCREVIEKQKGAMSRG